MPNQRTLKLNQKAINGVCFGIKAKEIDDFSPAIEQSLYTIAKQCYVEGGASVFYARAIWEGLNKKTDFEFQDNCLQTYGSYKTSPEGSSISTKSSKPFVFELFPNPSSRQDNITLLSSENGKLMIVDVLGRKVKEIAVKVGITTFQINEAKGVYNLLFVAANGNQTKSKIVVYE